MAWHLATLRLRLTHPDLHLWIDVRLGELEGRWLAVAGLAASAEPESDRPMDD